MVQLTAHLAAARVVIERRITHILVNVLKNDMVTVKVSKKVVLRVEES
jgi:hypothetical protein